jgi:hypothetical protein
MNAVARESLNLAIVNYESVLSRTILLSVVQKDSMDGLCRCPPPPQEKSSEMYTKGTCYI